jgi:hypothetical protein
MAKENLSIVFDLSTLQGIIDKEKNKVEKARLQKELDNGKKLLNDVGQLVVNNVRQHFHPLPESSPPQKKRNPAIKKIFAEIKKNAREKE